MIEERVNRCLQMLLNLRQFLGFPKKRMNLGTAIPEFYSLQTKLNEKLTQVADLNKTPYRPVNVFETTNTSLGITKLINNRINEESVPQKSPLRWQ